MKKAKIFMKKITSESKKTVTQNPDAGFRRKSEKPEQQIPFHDRTIPAPTDDTNQPDKAESFRSLGLRNQTEIPNLPERSQKILPGPQKILLRLPVPELRRKLREKLFRILVPHCLQNRFSETNGLGTPPISLGNLHRPTGTKQQPPNQPAQTKQPLPVRKNATAFFSGQGLCPCRGPAARRWSCGARNPHATPPSIPPSIPTPFPQIFPNQQHSLLQIQPGEPGGNDHFSVPEHDPVRSSGQKINLPQDLQALRIRGIKHRHLSIAAVGENDL